jgi:hypothetical protein
MRPMNNFWYRLNLLQFLLILVEKLTSVAYFWLQVAENLFSLHTVTCSGFESENLASVLLIWWLKFLKLLTFRV